MWLKKAKILNTIVHRGFLCTEVPFQRYFFMALANLNFQIWKLTQSLMPPIGLCRDYIDENEFKPCCILSIPAFSISCHDKQSPPVHMGDRGPSGFVAFHLHTLFSPSSSSSFCQKQKFLSQASPLPPCLSPHLLSTVPFCSQHLSFSQPLVFVPVF